MTLTLELVHLSAATPGNRGETGARGPRGLNGPKGDRGDDALAIVNWHIDDERYRAIPFMSNGTMGPALEPEAAV